MTDDVASAWKDALYRIVRTYLQAFVALMALASLPLLANAQAEVTGNPDLVTNLDFWRSFVFALFAAAVVAAITALHNLIETWTGKSFLKPTVRDEPNA